MQNVIVRTDYLRKIEQYFFKETIVVLTGQRRVGKSYVLKALAEEKTRDVKANVIYIDKEKREFDWITKH